MVPSLAEGRLQIPTVDISQPPTIYVKVHKQSKVSNYVTAPNITDIQGYIAVCINKTGALKKKKVNRIPLKKKKKSNKTPHWKP